MANLFPAAFGQIITIGGEEWQFADQDGVSKYNAEFDDLNCMLPVNREATMIKLYNCQTNETKEFGISTVQGAIMDW